MVTTGYCPNCRRTVYYGRGAPGQCPVCLSTLTEVSGDGEGNAALEERLGRNEARARELNERLEENDREQGKDGPAEFACECGDRECTKVITMSLGEYERVRTNGRHFAVVPGHEIDRVEDVIQRTDTFLVVEKNRRAGDLADATDPRNGS